MNNFNTHHHVEPIYRALSVVSSTNSLLGVEGGVHNNSHPNQKKNMMITMPNRISKGGVAAISTTLKNNLSSTTRINNNQSPKDDDNNDSLVSKCFVQELPVPITLYPLSKNSIAINDETKVDGAMTLIATGLCGELNNKEGTVSICLKDCKAKACAIKCPVSGKVFIEFDRQDGCAFAFQRLYYKAIVSVGKILEYVNMKAAEERLSESEKRLELWSSSVKLVVVEA